MINHLGREGNRESAAVVNEMCVPEFSKKRKTKLKEEDAELGKGSKQERSYTLSAIAIPNLQKVVGPPGSCALNSPGANKAARGQSVKPRK